MKIMRFAADRSLLEGISYWAGVHVLLCIMTTYTLVVASFFLGQPLTVVICPLACLISLVAVQGMARHEGLVRWHAMAVFAVLLVVSSIVASFVYDLSYDGQNYHQNAIIALRGGWNPFYEYYAGDTPVWVNHYPKFSEIVAAALYAATGVIETGKVLNILLLCASFLIVFSSLLKRFNQLRVRTCALYAGLFAFNPVSVYQSLSFYVDGILGSLLLILLFIVFDDRARPRRIFWLVSVIVILLTTTKYTGLIYALLMLLVAGYFALVQGKPWRHLAGAAVCGILAGVFIYGFNPYVVNLMQGRHLMYPVMGGERVDIMTDNSPYVFQGKSRLHKFGYALFACSDNVQRDEPLYLKVPLSVRPWEIGVFRRPDCRIGGWGVFFSALMLAGIAVYFAYGLYRIHELTFIIGAIVLSVVVNPEFWWARYSPHLWFLPIMIFLYARGTAQSGVGLRLIQLLAVTNVAIISAVYLFYTVSDSRRISQELAHLASYGTPVQVYSETESLSSFMVKLRKAGIAAVPVTPAAYYHAKASFKRFPRLIHRVFYRVNPAGNERGKELGTRTEERVGQTV